MQASEQTFSKIIQSDNGIEHYHIPKYQRAYSWRQNNWAQLYDDIDENDPGHFIGSIICIDERKKRKPGHDIIFELIDGQQRMTTVSLMLIAIYYKLNDHLSCTKFEDCIDEEDFKEIEAKHRSIGLQLVRKIKSDFCDQKGAIKSKDRFILLRIQPSSQNDNLNDYLCILSEAGILNNKEIKYPAYFGNRLMAKAYRYFKNRLPNDIEDLLTFADKINQLQLVHISVDSHSNAFKLFETLNNRGVPLTAVDIIKNKMLAEMEKQHNTSIDDAYNSWQKLLENIEDVEDRFLRQYYNAFKHKKDIRQPAFASKATSSTLIAIYEKIIESNAQMIFDDLIAKAKIYGKIIQPDEASELGLALVELDRIGAVTANTLLMYLMTLEAYHFSETDTLLAIISFLQKYYVRRNITDTPNTRDLDQIQIDTIEACENRISNNKRIDVDLISSVYCKGRGEPASLASFAENLRDNLFYYNKPMARYILIKLDERAHTREYSPDFWARNNKGIYIWTVEHVFPQGENIPKHWVDMIANGDISLAKNIQEELVHCLGNLTLSGYNSKLSNHSFDRKQSKFEISTSGHKINIGYKNGLYLNNLCFGNDGDAISLATIDAWKKNNIIQRNKAMVEILTEQYRFDHEMPFKKTS